MKRLFHLKILGRGATWGIVVFLKAELICLDKSLTEDSLIRITDNIYVENRSGINLLEEEFIYTKKALLNFRDNISERMLSDRIAILVIHNFDFALTDYQSEGLYFALLGWLCDEFNIKAPEINYTFNKELNRYVFK